MKDRFVLAGALVLFVAVASTAWLVGSRTTTPATDADPSLVTISPTAPSTLAVAATPVALTTVALVVPLDGLGGAAAFAEAGDHVSVLAFIPGSLNEGSASTRVLLPDVPVLRTSADTAVTVSVSPDQALLVRSAQSLGVRMFALLRPVDDSITTQMPEVMSDVDVRARLRPTP